eukprot:CAMPEP_0174380124 /NCGR_PEP_ID=MMETSP0811_2-20130205/123169_1 /TAXON_ID=73025 ORGANISM="Eutreptiella gymnastica-like, Strain CCMP1594" /NCGR_SAMPLE_ID=MMETSP0811_2 /ASSEMBLY_ACC=CAM_ASM_000667 /LENGTH=111 /DNA_ID=CAMNT_0015532897 /DNA_START=443 /DNA_END=778 /DNA_ORIENTATION=+
MTSELWRSLQLKHGNHDFGSKLRLWPPSSEGHRFGTAPGATHSANPPLHRVRECSPLFLAGLSSVLWTGARLYKTPGARWYHRGSSNPPPRLLHNDGCEAEQRSDETYVLR